MTMLLPAIRERQRQRVIVVPQPIPDSEGLLQELRRQTVNNEIKLLLTSTTLSIPRIILGHLPQGQRRIPHLLKQAMRHGPAAIIMLADETLESGAESLAGGLVQLVGRPWTITHLLSAIGRSWQVVEQSEDQHRRCQFGRMLISDHSLIPAENPEQLAISSLNDPINPLISCVRHDQQACIDHISVDVTVILIGNRFPRITHLLPSMKGLLLSPGELLAITCSRGIDAVARIRNGNQYDPAVIAKQVAGACFHIW